jgi:C_GCAxxG_C_C family probable redox protein
MTTDQRVGKARELFLSGYNCAQSVAAPFTDLTKLDENTVLRMASSFGGGVGHLKEVCGVVSGMALIAGLLYGDINPAEKATKDAHYERVQAFALKFKDEFGSLICRDLLDRADKNPNGEEPYASRPCLVYVENAAEILDKWIKEQG